MDIKKIIAFLLVPQILLYDGIKYFHSRGGAKSLILFLSFFGLTIYLGREGMDGYRHALTYQEYGSHNLNWFLIQILEYFTFQPDRPVDIYIVVVNFIFSRFSSSPNHVFLFHSYVFAYYFVNTLKLVIADLPQKKSILTILLFSLLIFVYPISNIHGVRYPIATWIYVYFVYKFLSSNNKKHLAYVLLAPLVHFSFFYAVLGLYFYALIGNRVLITSGFFILSYFFPTFFKSFIGAKLEFGESISGKISTYGNEAYIQERGESRASANWYKALYFELIYWVMKLMTLIVYVFKGNSKYDFDKTLSNIFNYLLILLAFINFGEEFESLGKRLTKIAAIFLVIFCFRFFKKYYVKSVHKYLAILLVLPTMLHHAMIIRIFAEVSSPLYFVGNGLISFFYQAETSIIELIKN